MRDVVECGAADAVPAVLAQSGCRVYRLKRTAAGFREGDILLVLPGAEPEGGEIIIDLEGRLGRHGGGPVAGVVVGAVRRGKGAR